MSLKPLTPGVKTKHLYAPIAALPSELIVPIAVRSGGSGGAIVTCAQSPKNGNPLKEIPTSLTFQQS
jgi:hypothetical protein